MKQSELDALIKDAERAKVLEQELATLKNGAKSNNTPAPDSKNDEATQLRRQLEERNERDRKNQIAAYRAKFEKTIEQELAKQNADPTKYNGQFGKYALEDAFGEVRAKLSDEFALECGNDEVWGEKKMTEFVATNCKAALAKQATRYEEYVAARKREEMKYVGGSFSINAASAEGLMRGLDHEKTYGSDKAAQGKTFEERFRDVMLQRMWNGPVTNPKTGKHFLEAHFPRINALIAEQRKIDINGSSDPKKVHWFGPGGLFHNALMSEGAKKSVSYLMEADENTTTNVFGSVNNLPTHITGLILNDLWPRLLMREVASFTGTMDGASDTVFLDSYPFADTPLRLGQHFFGAVDSDTPTTLDTTKTLTTSGVVANDQGALSRASRQYPSLIYGILGELVDADTTITITGTDQNGDSATAVAKFYTTDAVGKITWFYPTQPGTMFVDVTGVSSTGWTDAAAKGEVGIFAPDEIIGHTAGSQAQKARSEIIGYNIKARSYDLAASIDRELIEDALKSLASGKSSGLDYVARITMLMSQEVSAYIEREGLDSAVQNLYLNNMLTFDSTVPQSGLSPAEWTQQLHLNIGLVKSRVKYSNGVAPDWMIMNENDEPYFTEWLRTQGVISVFDPVANDPFVNARALYRLKGMDVYVSQYVPLKRILMGSKQGATGLVSKFYVPLTIFSGANPNASFQEEVMIHSRGYHGVPLASENTGKPPVGRSLGLVKVTR